MDPFLIPYFSFLFIPYSSFHFIPYSSFLFIPYSSFLFIPYSSFLFLFLTFCSFFYSISLFPFISYPLFLTLYFSPIFHFSCFYIFPQSRNNRVCVPGKKKASGIFWKNDPEGAQNGISRSVDLAIFSFSKILVPFYLFLDVLK